MELFNFCRLVLAVIVTVSVWPVSVPLAALAYRVRLGPARVPFETSVFWARATFAGLGSSSCFFLTGLSGAAARRRSGWARQRAPPTIKAKAYLMGGFLPSEKWGKKGRSPHCERAARSCQVPNRGDDRLFIFKTPPACLRRPIDQSAPSHTIMPESLGVSVRWGGLRADPGT